jgi:hypothetical protein
MLQSEEMKLKRNIESTRAKAVQMEAKKRENDIKIRAKLDQQEENRKQLRDAQLKNF